MELIYPLKSDDYYDNLLRNLDKRFTSYINAGTYEPTHKSFERPVKLPHVMNPRSVTALVQYNRERQQKHIKCADGSEHDYKLMPHTFNPKGQNLEKCTNCRHRRTALSLVEGTSESLS